VPPQFSIFKTRDDGSLHFVEGAEDLESAKVRVEGFAKLWLGTYVDCESRSGREAVHQHRRREDSLGTLTLPRANHRTCVETLAKPA